MCPLYILLYFMYPGMMSWNLNNRTVAVGAAWSSRGDVSLSSCHPVILSSCHPVILPAGLLLVCSLSAPCLLLVCCRSAPGLLLVCCRSAAGLLLVCGHYSLNDTRP